MVGLGLYCSIIIGTEDEARDMFYRVIAQCTQALQSIEVWLDKAEQHAKLKKYDVAILMTSRLAPDQDHFITQVQFACDYILPRNHRIRHSAAQRR